MAKVEPIPVVLVTEPGQLLALDAGTVLLRLPANSGHGHPDGQHCLACATRTDVRALLYDLLEEVKRGMRPAFTRVIVDASALPDPSVVVAALTGKLPAQALRDHSVARLFYLADAA
ncbi:hypothetical protein [Devosia beringensis]|uniref:hypothetical protein n=1 Tax=Devosia beringensis TaxID=2657486 RepID=UPI00186BA6A1|nr:hypothetical protein [Devosia beringensis]